MGTVRDPACRSYESSSDALAVPPSSTGVAAGSTLPQIEVVGVQETAHHSAARERSASIGTQGCEPVEKEWSTTARSASAARPWPRVDWNRADARYW